MSEVRFENPERDDELRALYRETAREEPPAKVDDAIRAAARRAVGSKPRPLGTSFMHAWRVPLSIAAVMVLSVSLITIMREENPDLTEPPRADTAPGPAERPVTLFPPLAEKDSAKAGAAPAQRESGGLGLKPSRGAAPSGLGMRSPSEADRAAGPRLEAVPGERQLAQAPPPSTPKANAFPRSEGVPSTPAAPVPRMGEAPMQRDARETEQRAAPSASAAEAPPPAGYRARAAKEPDSADRAAAPAEGEVRDRPSAPARPAAKPAPRAAADAPVLGRADEARDARREQTESLAPAKWIERIESLRREGKITEAKASLAEFRKKHPDYVLPASLKDWAP